ncbi:MAG: type II secretion system protein [Patescibacteria group bacterium]|jgi:prepilin-type N-terminal cleavage/methylation domain-containing protein
MEKDEKNPENKKGFTLIELLIVIAIIGILSTIGLVQLNGGREKALNAKASTDARSLMNALMVFADDNNGALPTSHCMGQAPTCFSYGPGFPEHTCLGAGRVGLGANSYCRIGESSAAPCSGAGPTQSGDSAIATKMLPYINRNIQTNPILSPVTKKFTSGYPSFIYISHSPGGTFWGHTVVPGAYFAWFKSGCQSFTDSECPGGLFLPSNCGNDKNGCAYYLGVSSSNPGTPVGSCLPPAFINPIDSTAGALKLRWF